MQTAGWLAVAAAVGAVSATELNAGRMSVQVSTSASSAAYTVLVDGQPWFDSASQVTGGFAYSASDTTHTAKSGAIMPGEPSSSSGSDSTGPFTSIAIPWSRRSEAAFEAAEWVTTFKAYPSRNAIVFQQTWSTGVTQAKGGSAFPSLHATAAAPPLGTLEYCGSSCGFMVAPHGQYPGITGGSSKGYIVIAPKDTTGAGANVTLSIGPVTEHFVNQARNDGDAITYGMAGSFEFVPPGYTIETVLTASAPTSDPLHVSIPSNGVNAALFAYGDFVLARHSKQRALGDHNVETQMLGYSTTAFYFYNLCDCIGPVPGSSSTHNRKQCASVGGKSPIPTEYLGGSEKAGTCDSYEDTLLAVDDALKEQGIPYHHILLDSWWYGEGVFGGASLWEDVPDCVGMNGSNSFPRGLHAFQGKVNKTLWVHNGKWTSDSPYRAKYPFVPSGAPQGPALWDHLFQVNHDGWNLGTIKQDHMGEEMGSTKSGWTNVSVFKSWLSGMGEAAARNDVGVLYCCAPPVVHMNGVTVPAAYAVRASPDYVWQGGGRVLKLPTVQWAIGPDLAFHWNGLGLLGYKDTFMSNSTMSQQSGTWTSDPSQWPPFANYHELNAETHALMSLLSMASVTFGDAVGQSNKTLLMQLVRADGMLLKADRPATPLDDQFQAMMFGSWPGNHGGGGHGNDAPLTLLSCSDGNANQQWVFDKETGGIQLAVKGGGCVDVKACNTDDGATVDLFPMPPQWVCGSGSPKIHGTCDAMNEKWSIVPNNSTDNPGQFIVSGLNNGCLRVKNGDGATLVKCEAADPYQVWQVKSTDGVAATFTAETTQTVTIETAQHDDQMCLTGSLNAALDRRDWHGFNSEVELAAAAERLFPTAGMSDKYKKAYAVSAEYVRRMELRNEVRADAECPENRVSAATTREGEGQCKRGFGAPQGPTGEVYSTHTTVSNLTWRYVVGVQLSDDFNVTAAHVGLDSAGSYVTYAWNHNLGAFKPSASDVRPFGHGSPLTLAKGDGAMCHTGQGQINVSTPCFPASWHAIAPALPNGWTVLGEVGKLMPVSSVRMSAVTATPSGVTVGLKGQASESVEFGAVSSGRPVYRSTVLDSTGTGSITFGGN